MDESAAAELRVGTHDRQVDPGQPPPEHLGNRCRIQARVARRSRDRDDFTGQAQSLSGLG
jgi:hypothetical protein